MNGWRVFWLIAAALTAVFAVALDSFGTEETGLRALVRLTARLSFALFLPVYLAAPLRRLWPTPGVRWLRRNRRYLGVSFAWAHGLHGLAIVMLAILLGDAFESDPVTLVFGGFTYVLLAGMTLTSFDRSAHWLGPQRWNLLHRTGIHALWLLFAVSWATRAASSPLYLMPTAMAFAAATIRFVGRRKQAAPGALPTSAPAG